MPSDWHIRGFVEENLLWFSILACSFPVELPVTPVQRREVLLLLPCRTFLRMAPLYPPPQFFVDRIVHRAEHLFAGPKGMIPGPPVNDRIEHFYQCRCLYSFVGFDDSSDFLKECMRVFLGGLGEHFSVRISAHLLSKENKPLLYGRRDCFLLREFPPTFFQELLDQRLDLVFQEFFRSAGDDEVVGVPYLMHQRVFVAALGWKACFQSGFQSIECEVGQYRGENATLWHSFFSTVLGVLIHESGLQPFLEYCLVHWDIGKEPGMADGIKA